MIHVHSLPADKLFKVFVKDADTTRLVLWFRCSNNGDLVTRSLTTSRNVFEVKGNFDSGRFDATTTPERLLDMTDDNEKDHLHLTLHPSSKKYPTPILNGIKRRAHPPRFDLRNLDRLQEVAIHLLASPQYYHVEAPKLEKEDERYHAVLDGIYGNQQPRLSFWVAPIDRKSGQLMESDILEGCVLYARVSPKFLNQDILLQVKLDYTPYSEYGDMHIMAAPIHALNQP
jgi:hypothetical protein